MEFTKKMILFAGAVTYLSIPTVQAQNPVISADQIVGKWILKSASFNKEAVPAELVASWVSFEFGQDGKVLLKYADGKTESGDYLVRENKLIDPNAPEFLNADIISLSDESLILAMDEDTNRIVMTFELTNKQ